MLRKITAFAKLAERMLNENGDNRPSPSILLSDRRSHAPSASPVNTSVGPWGMSLSDKDSSSGQYQQSLAAACHRLRKVSAF